VDVLDALQLRATLAILKPDREAWKRYICRWYSKEFHTPLDQVYDLPMEFILTNYFEAAVEAMDEEQRAEYLAELVLTDEERAKLAVEETKAVSADEAFLDELTEKVKAGATKGPPKEHKKGFVRKLIKDSAAATYGKVPVSEAATPAPPPGQPVEGPDIRANFGGNLLDEMGDLDPLAPRPPKKV
jgi:succinate dehydrogenase flavin-adding protein (antitoxin of CptAB toxin-antitoxin module)